MCVLYEVKFNNIGFISKLALHSILYLFASSFLLFWNGIVFLVMLGILIFFILCFWFTYITVLGLYYFFLG